MLVYKCDLCNKTVKEKDEKVYASVRGMFSGYTFCKDCGKPIKDFLIKKKLIKKPHFRN